MRSILKTIKFLLDLLRSTGIDVYKVIVTLSPFPLQTIRMLGAVIGDNVRFRGTLRAWEPAWLQINSGAEITDVTVEAGAFLLVDFDSQLKNVSVKDPLIITPQHVRHGTPLANSVFTLSFDLEGGVGLSHVCKVDFDRMRAQWDSKEISLRMQNVLAEYEIKSTWATCGHLFLEECSGNHGYAEEDWFGDWFTHDPMSDWTQNSSWYMPDLVRHMIDNPYVEVGYHSFGHFNYIRAQRNTVMRDMAFAEKLREEWDIPLRSLVAPYNALGNVDLLVSGGFSSIRGYVGQFYQQGVWDFGDFTYCGTSKHFSPNTVKSLCTELKAGVPFHYNCFTHPEEWVNDELHGFRLLCETLAELQSSQEITIEFMGDLHC